MTTQTSDRPHWRRKYLVAAGLALLGVSAMFAGWLLQNRIPTRIVAVRTLIALGAAYDCGEHTPEGVENYLPASIADACGRIPYIRLHDTDITARDVRALLALQEVRGAGFHHTGVSDDEVALLSGWRNLEGLSLTGLPDVTGVAFARLRNLPLKSLVLKRMQLSEAGAAALRELENLERLSLIEVDMTEEAVCRLSGHSGLRHAFVDVSGLGDRAAETVVSWPNIVSVTIAGEAITEDGLATIARHAPLRTIVVFDTGLPAETGQRLDEEYPEKSIRVYARN